MEMESEKKSADPNLPKKPVSAFIFFLKKYSKEPVPDVDEAGEKVKNKFLKDAGEKWKSLSNAEKEPYELEANLAKEKYEEKLKLYYKRQISGPVYINTEDDNDFWLAMHDPLLESTPYDDGKKKAKRRKKNQSN